MLGAPGESAVPRMTVRSSQLIAYAPKLLHGLAALPLRTRITRLGTLCGTVQRKTKPSWIARLTREMSGSSCIYFPCVDGEARPKTLLLDCIALENYLASEKEAFDEAQNVCTLPPWCPLEDNGEVGLGAMQPLICQIQVELAAGVRSSTTRLSQILNLGNGAIVEKRNPHPRKLPLAQPK